MDSLLAKFRKHAEVLKEKIERSSGGAEGDTSSINFSHEGISYNVVVTFNTQTLAASLWKGSWCVKSVEGKDGVLFTASL